MRESTKSVVFVVCLVLLAIGALALIGVQLGSDWSSFVPDIIVGVVGAGAIASLIAFVQTRSDRHQAVEEAISGAYRDLLDQVGEMRSAVFDTSDTGVEIRKLTSRMVNLAELLDDREPDVMPWFSAERQLMLLRVGSSLDAYTALQRDGQPHTPDDFVDAIEPLGKWTAEFTHNLRFWRTGKLSRSLMREQTTSIESFLREKGKWADSPLPWRDDIT